MVQKKDFRFQLNSQRMSVKLFIGKISEYNNLCLFIKIQFIFSRICTKLDLKTKSHGKQGSRQLVVVKKQSPEEIFYELSNCSNFENDYYILRPPRHETNN